MKNPAVLFVAWAFILSPPVSAQEAIQIEIDSAPVEIEIQQPEESPGPQEPTAQKSAEKPEDASNGTNYGVAIGLGALVAGALAALAGGGGGSGGGTSTTPQH